VLITRRVINYPVINHSRARGLLHKLRFRLLAVAVRGVLRARMCCQAYVGRGPE
jgi:hypothetical protein